ncbi:isovaleryl-CoA dehydrogenase [Bordetella pseudohinzii]|uniref:Acyl-CoA dehydrogenase n=2 Tax=Bordetella pseudohinzii TaxID=1331258 RepID=A0A0J6BZD0_9BORD|nr:isovaleryl-CoA dehydrogenase [Bordetella pseudohinzii]ANY15669.1 acyl-CoA dehydrogenase [Bordetella pseudohinzii]KMM27004.1 acyl-CoA dehydrogenase [Bordetella pseudohinzii]KXA78251.1 acyl-CoA dehydrogenase [Bordetella pseudohinzii]KXA82388.1 acyl-CoA dehydrogenase [Bordetella pseudohinzii]CUI54929.1 Putative acyl-CoA dehydrogenase AidB [Bordetella pseudohinzii]
MQPFATHQVTNQVGPLEDYSLFDTDPALKQAVARAGAPAAELAEHGAWLGRAQTLAAAVDANRHSPLLQAYDPAGHRIDHVAFHPAWALLMSGAMKRGLHCRSWAQPGPAAHLTRAAGFFLQGQVEAGTLCPVTMTHAAIPLLMREPAGAIDYARDWLPRLLARGFDGADAPLGAKQSALLGMGLTEKQGGSDLRAITTQARPQGRPGRGQPYWLVGHKWFLSVPQADAHLVLARGDEGISCFFMPRWIPGGPRNAVRLRRLKDKLGNRSNASAEVEFEDAWAVLLGEPGKGMALLLEMAATTRLDCVLGSAALLRQGLVQAMHHAQQRQAFGRALVDQPIMRAVLADLALESEAAMLLGLRLAQAMDGGERLLLRVATPAAKLWVCKRAIAALGEAMEALGGNGYVEEGPLARLYREAPVNSIWEGSGNVMALDVLRALAREPQALEVLRQELALARGLDARYDQALAAWLALAARPEEGQGRDLAGGLARLMQAALMLRHAPQPLGQAFAATRLAAAGLHGENLPAPAIAAILARAWPAIC